MCLRVYTSVSKTNAVELRFDEWRESRGVWKAEAYANALNTAKNSSIIRNIDVDDVRVLSEMYGFDQRIVDVVIERITEAERTGLVYFNDFSIQPLGVRGVGGTPLLQTEPYTMGRQAVIRLMQIKTF